MSLVPRLFRRFLPQLLHMIVLPLFVFAFTLVYRPLGVSHMIGPEFFGVHVTIATCIVLVSVIIMRVLYYFLPLRLNYTLYTLWCVGETLFMSFFVALYLWLVLDKPAPYFDIMMYSFKYLFFTLPIPYAILALSIKVYDSNTSTETAEVGQKRMRFYDVSHNLKFVITSGSILYIGADVNYVNIYYLDNGKVKCYVLRNSMRSIDEVCLSNGLVRCHRSFYINPSHVKVLRKDKEGVVYAVLDADDVRDIPVSKKFYNNLTELL